MIKVDLHLHSRYSDKAAGFFSKKLDMHESYVTPKQLYDTLYERDMDLFTITDHNEIAGCLEIADLPGVFISEEATAYFPEDRCKVHVLCYDITEAQHEEIGHLRYNIYEFVDYLQDQGILHVLAHPLYDMDGKLSQTHIEKCLLMFDNWEIINGTRSGISSRLTQEIAEKFTGESLQMLASKHGFNKRGGAWMHNWQSHCRDEDGEEQLASAFIVCNFPPSSEDNPSLLRHDDVVTLFHEMGHALHHLLSTVDENGVSGVNGVEWDAVEFPSQFLENFAYEPQVLRLFAKHHETGEVLSELMIERLVKAKDFQAAMAMLRQLEFAMFDFRLHMGDYQGDAIQTLLDEIREETALLRPPAYNKFQNGFTHIFAGGYAAGYYSYKWAEVLSADAFYAIVDQGIFDTKLGRDYLDIVLSNGGSSSMRELFHELMGRDPETSNLLRLNGIR